MAKKLSPILRKVLYENGCFVVMGNRLTGTVRVIEKEGENPIYFKDGGNK